MANDSEVLNQIKEISKEPCNRKCCDCGQVCPIYVNCTVGSFICTPCSGVVRGLVPPHRVKSILLADFTQKELDFLSRSGNERVNKRYLSNVPADFVPLSCSCTKLERNLFINNKYQKKRWYKDDMGTQPAESCRQPPLATKKTKVDFEEMTTCFKKPASIKKLFSNNISSKLCPKGAGSMNQHGLDPEKNRLLNYESFTGPSKEDIHYYCGESSSKGKVDESEIFPELLLLQKLKRESSNNITDPLIFFTDNIEESKAKGQSSDGKDGKFRRLPNTEALNLNINFSVKGRVLNLYPKSSDDCKLFNFENSSHLCTFPRFNLKENINVPDNIFLQKKFDDEHNNWTSSASSARTDNFSSSPSKLHPGCE